MFFHAENERPMMVDYMIWPWFERMLSLPVMYGVAAQFPEKRYPKLVNSLYFKF